MAGLYIHIPFCKQACHYCNFHFSTNLSQKSSLVDALIIELELQQEFLKNKPLQSIYLGGGTPSLLNESELNRLFDAIQKFHEIEPNAEVTLEANPDDLSKDYLKILEHSPVNRLSIGVQSFFDKDLQWMNRAHDASQATGSLSEIRNYGFENFSIDLIYGAPSTTEEMWKENLEKAFELNVPHISSYALTVEEGTALGNWVKKGKVENVDTEKSLKQFKLLQSLTVEEGYRHYEISNLAKRGFEAVHNSNYWQGVPYLGIGPAAHSFDGHSRQWNVNSNAKYLKSLSDSELNFEKEILSSADQFNEYVMTGLRCDWGISLEHIRNFFPTYYKEFDKVKTEQVSLGALVQLGDKITLVTEARFLADGIASEFFILNA